ncbi:MAG: DNA-binding protein [Acidimicrobiales bacterium]|nr:DNA-binding protein [Acidimicrobiales bacterium]
MGRRIDVDDLVGAEQVAERLKLKKASLVHDWIRRDIGFPEPAAKLGSIRVWAWPEVEKWARMTGRL